MIAHQRLHFLIAPRGDTQIPSDHGPFRLADLRDHLPPIRSLPIRCPPRLNRPPDQRNDDQHRHPAAHPGTPMGTSGIDRFQPRRFSGEWRNNLRRIGQAGLRGGIRGHFECHRIRKRRRSFRNRDALPAGIAEGRLSRIAHRHGKRPATIGTHQLDGHDQRSGDPKTQPRRRAFISAGMKPRNPCPFNTPGKNRNTQTRHFTKPSQDENHAGSSLKLRSRRVGTQ